MEKAKITVEYCTGWGFLPVAIRVMDEVLNLYQKEIAAMTFLPSSGGVFEVTVGGELIFSKKATNRFPEDGEIAALLAQKQGW